MKRRGQSATAIARAATGKDLPSTETTGKRRLRAGPGPQRRKPAIGGARLAAPPRAGDAGAGSAPPRSPQTVPPQPPSADARGRSETSTRRVWECGSGAPVGRPLGDRMRPPGATPEGDPRTSACSVLGGRAHGQAFAALPAPSVQDSAPPPRAHPRAEPVLSHALAVTRLICWLPHRVFSAFGRENYPSRGLRVKVDFPTWPRYVRSPCWTPYPDSHACGWSCQLKRHGHACSNGRGVNCRTPPFVPGSSQRNLSG